MHYGDDKAFHPMLRVSHGGAGRALASIVFRSMVPPMSSTSTARGALRAATAAHHDRVDAVFSQLNLGDRDGYRRFLQAQAGAHLPVEAALTRAGAAMVVPDWPARQRSAALLADLAALGLDAPAATADIAFDDTAAVLGGIYVLEGSRLGGALLARGVPAHFPRAFLAPSDSALWRRLLQIVEHTLISADARASAVQSASRVFMLFESSGRRFLGTD